MSRSRAPTLRQGRVMPFVALALPISLMAATMSSCGDDDPAGPVAPSIVGTWDLIGFSDNGVEAQTSGSWTFGVDGTHSFEGTVTYPDEPPQSIGGVGTYEHTGTTLVLVVGTESSTWTVEISSDLATLTEDEPPPANVIRLQRR